MINMTYIHAIRVHVHDIETKETNPSIESDWISTSFPSRFNGRFLFFVVKESFDTFCSPIPLAPKPLNMPHNDFSACYSELLPRWVRLWVVHLPSHRPHRSLLVWSPFSWHQRYQATTQQYLLDVQKPVNTCGRVKSYFTLDNLDISRWPRQMQSRLT